MSDLRYSPFDGEKLKAELLELLSEIANEIDMAGLCGNCAAQNPHDQCDQPDIAEAIRQVIKKHQGLDATRKRSNPAQSPQVS